MKYSEFKKLRDQELLTRLISLGFKKWKYGVVKVDKDFFIEIGFGSADYGFVYPSHFGTYCGFLSLDNLFNAIFEMKNQYYNLFNINQITLFAKKEYHIEEYQIKTLEDVPEIVREISHYFVEKLLPFFYSINTYEKLFYYLINYNKEAPRGSTTLILAKLLGDPDYENLKAEFRILNRVAHDFCIENLEKTIAFIESHSREELLAIANGA